MLNWIAIIIAAIVYSQLATFATSIYLHRTLAHRALKLNPLIALVFRATLWLTIAVVPREWVAVHRKHHTFTDKEEDPHSPLRMGFWKVQLGNYYYYRKEIKNKKTIQTFAKDLPPDFFDNVLFNHWWLGMLGGITVLATFIGPANAAAAWLLNGAIYILLSSTINGLCHWWGYKNFPAHSATNVPIVNLITAGEGLHNNHHGKPTCPKFSMKWHELDPSWLIIKTLTILKLAKPMPTVSL